MKKIFIYLMFWRSLPAITTYCFLNKETREKIKKDVKRISNEVSIIKIHELLLYNSVFRRIFMIRILEESIWKYRFVRWTYKPLESLEISSETGNIGGGLSVYHGYSTIIFCHSMGENCSVYQNVTIGRGKRINGIEVPIIGSNVTIYAGAIVIGGIHIGNNVTIGAGAVVVKDVPDNSVVVGSSMRTITN